MVGGWYTLARRTDDAVDEFFGQRVLLQPWQATSPYLQGGAADETRLAVECVGVVEMSMATPSQVGGQSFLTKVVSNQLTCSVQSRFLDEAQLKEGDVVYLHDDPVAVVQNLVCEVSYIDANPTGRSNIYLLRSQISTEAALQRKPTKIYEKPKGTIAKPQSGRDRIKMLRQRARMRIKTIEHKE